jgi:hypothetical protein
VRTVDEEQKTMLRMLEGLPENVLGVEAVGKVTDDDYDKMLIPAVRTRREAHGSIRFIYVLGEEFDGWTTRAMWEDAKLGLKDLNAWEKIAIVTNKESVKHTVKAIGWMIPGEVRVFELNELDTAKDWAAS